MDHRAAVELVTLPDGQYHTVSAERLRSLRSALSPSEAEIEGGNVPPVLAIGAPRVVDLQTVRRIPVLIATRTDAMRNWQVDPEQNFTWFLTDLTSGVTKSVSPQSLEKRRMATPEPSGSGKPPMDEEAKSITYGINRVHLPALFGPKWPPGRYAVTMVSYDRVSNTVVFETKPLPKNRPPVRLRPTEQVQAATAAGAGGNTLSVEAGEAAVVRVSISLAEDEAVVGQPVDPAETQPLLPVTLILIQLDSAVQTHFDLAVPATVTNGLVTTRFSVNLREMAGGEVLAGDYLVYLCAGATVTGPQPLHLR